MPIPVVKYTCKFRCGKKASGNQSMVKAHEDKCWNNKDNHTCKTCSNEIYEQDSDGWTQWTNRGCNIEEINSLFEDIQTELQGSNKQHIRPLFHCPFWNMGEVNKEDAKDFSEKIKSEIEESKSSVLLPTRIHFPYFHNTVTNIIFPEI